MKPDLSALRAKATTTLAGFSLGQKVVTALAVIGLVVGALMFTSWSSKPKYATLFTDLEAADAAAITQDLTSRKVPYELGDGGRTIQVPQGEVYQLRIDLSSKGLPQGGAQGYSLLDKQGITTSEFRQRVDYQRALEGELSRTIGAIEGVAGATVHLVIPKDDLFSDDAKKPSASVLVKSAPGASLAAGQVQAVVHLVSSSVEGLAPGDVTVADAKGRVLSAPGAEGASSAEGDARVAKTRGFEDELSKSVSDMLATVVGPGRAVVRVKADLDFDQRQSTSERLDPGSAVAVGTSSSKETFSGAGATPPGGVLGPDGKPLATPGQAGSYTKEDQQQQIAVGKVTEQVKAAPGTVKRLSVAVLLDATSPGASDDAAIRELVSAAAGIDAKRGDAVAVNRLAFDQSAKQEAEQDLRAAEEAKEQAETMGLIRQVAVLLVVGVIVLLALRSARKALKPVRTPLELAELERVRDTMALPATADADDEDVAEPAPPAELALVPAQQAQPVQRLVITPETPAVEREVAQLIEQQPEEVATLLRSWLSERR